MPEGPEVRRSADALHTALAGQAIAALSARTRAAKAWLETHPEALPGRRVERVRSRGKHMIGRIEGGYFFTAHLMMWGRWEILPGEPSPPPDRRERARIRVPTAVARLLNAPVFEIGAGDPAASLDALRSLGPDILPYPEEGDFDEAEFRRRLLQPANADRTIGAALLDQQIAAGIGNYLRAEILFDCRLDPWRRVADLKAYELNCLGRTIPALARRSYENGGATVTPALQARMREDPRLVYRPGREIGTRHAVFRRTNLPCLACGTPVRQARQMVRQDEAGERSRIIYFCPACQGVTPP